jgi:hypothetical protein
MANQSALFVPNRLAAIALMKDYLGRLFAELDQ